MSNTPSALAPTRALAPARRAGRLVERLRRISLVSWALPAALLIVWQASSSFGLLANNILPSPAAVAVAGWKLALSGALAQNVGISFLRAMAGLIVGGGIGFAFGFANGLSDLSERLTDTTLQMARNIPHLALIPLVILWFGIDEGAKLFLVALGVFFPIYINTLHGIRNVDPQLVEMGRSYGLTPRDLLTRVIFPGALPSILVGLRYALGIMWLTLIVAETIAAQSGIGYMAMQAREFLQTDVVVFSILVYAALGKLAEFDRPLYRKDHIVLASRFSALTRPNAVRRSLPRA